MNGRGRRDRKSCAVGVERLDDRVSLTGFGLSFGLGASAPAFSFGYTPPAAFTPAANTFAFRPGAATFTAYTNPFMTGGYGLNTGVTSFAPTYSFTASPFASPNFGYSGLQFGPSAIVSGATTTGFHFAPSSPLSNPVFGSGHSLMVRY